MPRLIALVAREGFSLPGLRAIALTTIEVGKGSFKNWRVHMRGPAVLLEAPAGWVPGGKTVGDRRMLFEIPRTSVSLQWELEPGDTDADLQRALSNYSTPIREVVEPAQDVAIAVPTGVLTVVDDTRPRTAAIDAARDEATDDEIEPDADDPDEPPVSAPVKRRR